MDTNTTVGHLIWPLQVYGHNPNDSDCKHEWKRWTGNIPCTGKYICGNCGKDFTPMRFNHEPSS